MTGSNHGNWPNLEVYSFQTTFGDSLTSTAPLYIHFLYFLDCFIPFGVTGRALGPIPAAMGEGRVHTLMSLQLNAGPSVSIWGLGKMLKVPWRQRCPGNSPLLPEKKPMFCPHQDLNREPSAPQPTASVYIQFLDFSSVVLFCGCWFLSNKFRSELYYSSLF